MILAGLWNWLFSRFLVSFFKNRNICDYSLLNSSWPQTFTMRKVIIIMIIIIPAVPVSCASNTGQIFCQAPYLHCSWYSQWEQLWSGPSLHRKQRLRMVKPLTRDAQAQMELSLCWTRECCANSRCPFLWPVSLSSVREVTARAGIQRGIKSHSWGEPWPGWAG